VSQLTDLPENLSGRAVEFVTTKRRNVERMIIKFNIPSRGIIGLRNQLLLLVRLLCHTVYRIRAFKGAIPGRNNGSLISMEMEKQPLFYR
jgi:GTP-binding protein